MEEVLSNQEARQGDATQLMHAIFSSDDEMMSFYLTLNCCLICIYVLIKTLYIVRVRLHYYALFAIKYPV